MVGKPESLCGLGPNKKSKMLGPMNVGKRKGGDDIITNCLPIRTLVLSLPLSNFSRRTCVVNHNARTT